MLKVSLLSSIVIFGTVKGQLQKSLEEYEEECNDREGFYYEGACIHFEGETDDGIPVDECPGGCSNWFRCITVSGEETCEKAIGYQANQDKELEEAGLDWGFLIMFCLGFIFISGCIITFAIILVKTGAQKNREALKNEKTA